MSASASGAVVGFVALGALVFVLVRNKADDPSPRNKAIWSLAAWCVVIVIGLAIWLIARGQISN